MFLGSGTVVEITEARVKSLERVLREYIEKDFTGYIVYRNDVQGVYIAIALARGRATACRAVDRGAIFEGDECCDIAMRYLYHGEGVVEVLSVPINALLIDIISFPLSRIERKTALISRLGVEIGIPPSIAETLPPIEVTEAVAAAPPPAIAPETAPPTAEEVIQPTPATASETAPPVEEAAPPPPLPPAPTPIKGEISVQSECIDPITLYTIMRSSQLLKVISETQLQDIVKELTRLASEKQPSYLYVSADTEIGPLRMVLNAAQLSLYIELEQSGNVICGNQALEAMKARSMTNAKIWLM